MTDPHRLLSNLSDADELERELLASIRQVAPPADAKSEAWTKLSVQLAAVGLVSVASVQSTTAASLASSAAAPASTAAAGASSAWLPGALKGLFGKLFLGVAVAGTGSALWVHAQREQPAPGVAASAVTVEMSPPQATTPSVEPKSEVTAPTAMPAAAPVPTESSVKPNSEASREDRLSAESKLLTHARAELRRGNSASAQQILEQMRVKFPNGVLGQEREVLSIEVLAARGNSDAAAAQSACVHRRVPEEPAQRATGSFRGRPVSLWRGSALTGLLAGCLVFHGLRGPGHEYRIVDRPGALPGGGSWRPHGRLCGRERQRRFRGPDSWSRRV